ncbi:ectoine/hydroxyectoine ABC transporter permease subunit EhuD [Virgibacillus sp. AGTR]|uniref:Ectoine/hydroxyectoine ABC transporter permease subunit EhuD n=1 Tax=Virgibacillus salarius TaxID=447199 RepID=A0A941ICQ8_9BACI|nr:MULTISPECIES: ectoine/hydroxyectoine ABC transporter permease subunit EhuD [Bacillaceae]NAZ10470.1 ectoine/hydroxyectoine ABC transporter permease subunit EhuD [Agaribacter marinus]MBR7797761.1 ectoine/hydroxyectoine ABC transporter permease subunit EhuD [Virgibacillus salarius]MCC2252015.1 ectoine/hydroxyectoine ABC transporter permease subunit EhuD [Virgibacillus sp. AGTR]MDY7046000.1 ectoine/hydroxyectoine ABC transporter permease subunit EhuD [Virgibacillus sp. M23]QRZ19590.1 ectoine/hy
MNIWSWDVFADAFLVIVQGLGITLGLTIACYLFALIFGFFWTFLRRIPFKPLHWVITWIMEFIRSTPPLVQLFFIFYAWPMVPVVGMTLDPFTSAILGLGIHFSTYIGEVYRSGIDGVDKGQWEAARALNFSTRQKWTKIILPQAIPPTIPMLGNYLIIMFKEVPLASTIGVAGILHMANSYGAQYWTYLEPLTIVAILFLVMSYPSALLINKLEKKMNRRFDKKEALNSSKGATA